MRDLTDISPTPVVTSKVYMGADGFQYVQVTIELTFTTVTHFPGVPFNSTLRRTTDMRVNPKQPKPGTF
jgi:hypothetical protein